MKHLRRIKPTRRQRVRRVIHVPRSRLYPARLFRIYPDPDEYPRAVVEVRFCRDTRRLCDSLRQQGYRVIPQELESAGVVRSGFGRRGRRWDDSRTGLYRGHVVAQMWLSVRALQRRPSEITSHECGHAAMAWARWRGANLGVMPGEEVMCYALGRLVAQLNRVCYAARAFE
jgi:hypothetical protein